MGYNPSDLHGISRVNPFITGVITHLLSGMNHQVWIVTVVSVLSGRGLFWFMRDNYVYDWG